MLLLFHSIENTQLRQKYLKPASVRKRCHLAHPHRATLYYMHGRALVDSPSVTGSTAGGRTRGLF